MPTVPCTGLPFMTPSSIEILPFAFRVSRPLPFIVEMPAESYPRYSSRFNPSMRRGDAVFDPTYPTIPHIWFCPGGQRCSTKGVERFAGFPDELVRVPGGGRLGYHSHDWLRS